MRTLIPVLLCVCTTAALAAALASAQEPPQVFWEADAEASTITFAPDGLNMYTGGPVHLYPYTYGNVRKWDVPSRTLLYTLTHGSSGRVGLTNEIAVSPDGAAFASAHGSIYCVPDGPCLNFAVGFEAWNAESGTPTYSVDSSAIDGIVEETAYSPDGRFVAFVLSRTNEDQIRVYNLPDFTLRDSREGHGNGTYCAAFSPVSSLLATGGWDGLVRLWDAETGQLLRTLDHGGYLDGGYPTSLAFSPDGTRLAVTGNGYNLKVTVWHPATGALQHALSADEGSYGANATVAISPNGRYAAAGVARLAGAAWEGAIRFWDLSDGALVREYIEAPIVGGGSPVVAVAVSPLAEDWYAYTYDLAVKFAATDLALADAPTDAPDDPSFEDAEAPAGFTARIAASPNPLRDFAMLRYEIPRTGPVQIQVFDAAGREVARPVAAVRAAGTHEVRLDAGSLAAGAYFCRIRAEGAYGSARFIVSR